MTAMTWKPVLSIPKTCLMLPLGGTEDPKEWAKRKCTELLGPEATDKTRRLFTETLAEETVKGRESRTQVLAGLFSTPTSTGTRPSVMLMWTHFVPRRGIRRLTWSLGGRVTVGRRRTRSVILRSPRWNCPPVPRYGSTSGASRRSRTTAGT